MLVPQIALVPADEGGDAAELARVGAALQKQVLRDVAPHWNIHASVSAFPRLEDVPVGYWPIVLTPRLQGWGAGVHLDDNGQPFAQVERSPHWTIDVSRACLELLVNPLGDRTVTAPSPRADQGLAQVLVELSGSCADLAHAYAIDGVLVSDFCTPAFFVVDEALGQRPCSFHGALTRPLSLVPGGHMTWFDVASGSWWMRVQRRDQHEDRRLGALERPFSSVRELLGRQRFSAPDSAQQEALAGVAARVREQAQAAASARAVQLRARLGSADEEPALLLETTKAAPGNVAGERNAAAQSSEIVPPPPAADETQALPARPEMQPGTDPNAYAAVHDHELELAQPTPAPLPTIPPRRPAKKPARQVRIAPATSTHVAGSSIMPPMIAQEPAPRPHKGRDTKLLLGAALAGIALFALVARERAAVSARARPHSPATHVSAAPAKATSPAAAAAPTSTTAAMPAPATQTAPASASSVASVNVADASVPPTQEIQPVAAATPSATKRAKRERRASPAVPTQPNIEDLIDTRR
jgi:hypothetical protein